MLNPAVSPHPPIAIRTLVELPNLVRAFATLSNGAKADVFATVKLVLGIKARITWVIPAASSGVKPVRLV